MYIISNYQLVSAPKKTYQLIPNLHAVLLVFPYNKYIFTPVLLTACLTERVILVLLPPCVNVYPLPLYEHLSWSNNRDAERHTAGICGLGLKQVHIVKPCHYHKVNHVISWLLLKLGGKLEAIHEGFGILCMGSSSAHFPVPLSAFFYYSSHVFAFLPSTSFLPFYSYVSLYVCLRA